MKNNSNYILTLIFVLLLSITFLTIKFIGIKKQEFEYNIFIFIALSEVLLYIFLLLSRKIKTEKIIFNTLVLIILTFNVILSILFGIFYYFLFSVEGYIFCNTILFLVSLVAIFISYLISIGRGESKDVKNQ